MGGNFFSHREFEMPITEIPNSGATYQVQPLDKDQASQQDQYRRGKKNKSGKRVKKQNIPLEKDSRAKGGRRIDLVV
jgi:hypothetical protein